MRRIILVEDDETAAEILMKFLEGSGFLVDAVTTATEGISFSKQNSYDLMILDINLPDFDGFEVLKNRTDIPVIVTSAYSEIHTKLEAFNFGASDYLVKPFDLEELEARIWVHLRRGPKSSNEKEAVSIENDTVYLFGTPLSFTPTEREIFLCLYRESPKTVKRTSLMEMLSSISSPRALDNHIKSIRKKLSDTDLQAHFSIKTEYGVGYRLHRHASITSSSLG